MSDGSKPIFNLEPKPGVVRKVTYWPVLPTRTRYPHVLAWCYIKDFFNQHVLGRHSEYVFWYMDRTRGKPHKMYSDLANGWALLEDERVFNELMKQTGEPADADASTHVEH